MPRKLDWQPISSFNSLDAARTEYPTSSFTIIRKRASKYANSKMVLKCNVKDCTYQVCFVVTSEKVEVHEVRDSAHLHGNQVRFSKAAVVAVLGQGWMTMPSEEAVAALRMAGVVIHSEQSLGVGSGESYRKSKLLAR